jgi:hypothetical protein
MIHNEHFRRGDELYEIWHDNNGQAIHMLIKDGEAIIFKNLHDFVLYNYLGTEVERVYMNESDLHLIPDDCLYNWYKIRDYSVRRVLEDTFVTALEGGSNYWVYIDQNTLSKVKKDGVPLSIAIFNAVMDGMEIEVLDIEGDGDVLGTLNLKTMADNLNLMMKSEVHSQSLFNVMRSDFDANDADVVFQYLVMGEVIFG